MKLLLSHVADLDGVTPVILSNLIGLDFEYELFDLNELSDFFGPKLCGPFSARVKTARQGNYLPDFFPH